jgi:hypothetical protein
MLIADTVPTNKAGRVLGPKRKCLGRHASHNAVTPFERVQAMWNASIAADAVLSISRIRNARASGGGAGLAIKRLGVLLIAGILAACGGGGGSDGAAPGSGGPPGGGDIPPGVVNITSPANGSVVSASVEVAASVTRSDIAGVQFQVDGSNIGVEDTDAPYAVMLDTTAAGDGPHTLTAIARDTAGNTYTSAAVTVTVANSTEPPPPPDPPVPGRFEETDAAVTLSPGWTAATPDWYARSGGSAVQSSVPLATATFRFTGTSVTLIGQRSNTSGIALVKVDGNAGVPVDLFAHNYEVNSPVYSLYGLSPGSHTLTVQVTGTQNGAAQGNLVVVDAFAVPASVVSHLQETDPAVVFTGTWIQDKNSAWSGAGLATDPAPPVGGAHVTESSGAKATLTFRGTEVSWLGYRGRAGGKASVSVDGGAPVIVDTYSSADRIQATVYTVTGLADVTHTMTIEALGTNNGIATGSRIVVDAFDVTTPGRRYQEEDPAVTYSPGDWIFRNLNRTWSEGSISESSTAGASVTFSFTGTSVSWIGCRKLSTGGANVYIDGALVEHVETWLDPDSVSPEAYQTTIFRKDGLSPGPHALKIVVSDTGPYTVIDAFDVRP